MHIAVYGISAAKRHLIPHGSSSKMWLSFSHALADMCLFSKETMTVTSSAFPQLVLLQGQQRLSPPAPQDLSMAEHLYWQKTYFQLRREHIYFRTWLVPYIRSFISRFLIPVLRELAIPALTEALISEVPEAAHATCCMWHQNLLRPRSLQN